MFFTIASPIINSRETNAWVLQGAKLSISLYKITPAQLKLNSYLWENYGLNIRAASLLVLANCKLLKNSSNEIVVTFPSKKIDQLASVITYGTGKIQGCSILKEAFLRDQKG